MDCMLGEGLDVVRGDVQTRLFGGAEEEVGRLVRFSDVVMIFCRLMDATETGGGDLRLSMKGAGAEQEGCTRAGSCKIETPETLKCFQMHVGRDRGGREDGWFVVGRDCRSSLGYLVAVHPPTLWRSSDKIVAAAVV